MQTLGKMSQECHVFCPISKPWADRKILVKLINSPPSFLFFFSVPPLPLSHLSSLSPSASSVLRSLTFIHDLGHAACCSRCVVIRHVEKHSATSPIVLV